MTQDSPAIQQLLEAVAEFLFTEVRESVPAEMRFRTLVAANVCAVAARELRAGEEPLREDLALFEELLGRVSAELATGLDLRKAVRAAQRELADRLRSGAFDDRLDELAGRLAEHVGRKLAVARPGYDAP